MGTTYWDYIRTEDLLSLQGGLEGDDARLTNHEVTFITVHQVFELWFKLVIRELESLRDVFARDVVPEQDLSLAARSLERIRRIFEVANTHWTVMESLNTRDYLDFRDKLFPASGFQSAQMREIEILLGLTDEERVGLGEGGTWRSALRTEQGAPSPALERVERRLEDRPSLAEALDAWLYRTPIRGSQPEEPDDEAVVDAFVRDFLERVPDARAWLDVPDERRRRIRAAVLFIESYRELPLLAWPREVLDRIVETEQALLVFRQRHARMVERVIGRRPGTGGSSGVDYLDATAVTYRVFKDLWSARTFLVRKVDLPALDEPGYYDFA